MSDTCKCGHDRRSHDLWGSGPCCDCDCDGFESSVAIRLAEFLRCLTPAQRAFYDSPISPVRPLVQRWEGKSHYYRVIRDIRKAIR